MSSNWTEECAPKETKEVEPPGSDTRRFVDAIVAGDLAALKKPPVNKPAINQSLLM
jgi:hypothetical protein